jgi:hypothetical protein
VSDTATVIIHDLSETGALIETNVKLSPGEQLKIDIREVGAARAAVVWSSGRFFGCEFDQRLPRSALSAAILRNGPLARPTPTAETADAAPSNDVAADENPERWPVAARMWALVILSAASWAAIGVAVWAALTVSGIA